MSIKMVEQRVCDFPGCDAATMHVSSCFECGRDFCAAHYLVVADGVNAASHKSLLCANCIVEKLPQTADNFGLKSQVIGGHHDN